jgi:hypothetical protein
MNMIKKLTNKAKMVFIAGSLLFGLALTPATSFAGNDQHEGRRNGGSHQVDNHQRNHQAENNRHHNKRGRHHMKQKHSHHGKHRNRRHNEPRYVVINNEHHHRSERLGLRIGLHSGNFDVVFRD